MGEGVTVGGVWGGSKVRDVWGGSKVRDVWGGSEGERCVGEEVR